MKTKVMERKRVAQEAMLRSYRFFPTFHGGAAVRFGGALSNVDDQRIGGSTQENEGDVPMVSAIMSYFFI